MGRYLGRCQDPECRRAVFTDSPGYDEYTGYDELYCGRHQHRPNVPESPIEELFLRAWQRAFPGIQAIPQYPVPPYYLDLGLPQLMIGIELDGAAYHGGWRKGLEDQYRQRQIEAGGWKVFRFTGSAVHAGPEACARRAGRLIAAELARRWTTA